ncbi:hypothetical protein BDBG_16609 [Blastomyces gilchristii SLH14081]|uniref:Uncharacterized protein n=1 Tax=Blastomyces gilchristii (strain SLH14081) TaxID=559298 RepID=A0A179UGJ0_BLAGS|nr:uncharacterized protein BDBG_16609 [Blastomyces gilchristii SLH14081]OAT06349.1 hypothetical protein BDBG_16609 [Blastomyces gilchristii SLH14081]
MQTKRSRKEEERNSVEFSVYFFFSGFPASCFLCLLLLPKTSSHIYIEGQRTISPRARPGFSETDFAWNVAPFPFHARYSGPARA